ncbi:conserved hypothetical protein [Paraburkholderia unamae]|uniref:DUF3592 domain-containing protein n=1 Tax=Paraburkholderia unamae TaxID=219649 RepID=UPI001CB14460|nr:DUF3592 domain-containing protein [Paraburkholderia unamae]CAG9269044.1 conserved hypothetical protein [Paraburkholderia unamae]
MRQFTLFFISIIWLGCIYGLIASLYSTHEFLHVANKAPGVVVALNADGSHPQIEFTNKRGDHISYPQGGLIFGYRIGDSVTVLYLENSRNPRATIDQFGAVWELSIYFTLMVVFIPAIELSKSMKSKFNKSDKWKITE